MRLLAAILFPALLSATTLTGTFNNPDGNGATGTLFLSLSQQGSLVGGGSCGGPLIVLPTYMVRIKVTAGAMDGTPTVYGNDCILPGGTWYNVRFDDANGNTLMNDRWLLSGTTVDIGTIVSVVIAGTTQIAGAPGILLTLPITNQTLTQPVGTNLNINNLNLTNLVTMPNGATCTTGGCTGFQPSNMVTVDSSQTIVGQKTFAADILAAPAVNLGGVDNPFNNGYAVTMWAGHACFVDGTFGTPTDFWCFFNPSPNLMQFVDSSSNVVYSIDETAFPNSFMKAAFSIMPATDSTYDLGSNTFKWQDLYLSGVVQFGTSTTGSSGAAALGSNCPAVTCSSAFTWIQARDSAGDTVYIPAFK